MKKKCIVFFAFLILFNILFSLTVFTYVQALPSFSNRSEKQGNKNAVVYITKYSRYYHTEDCSSEPNTEVHLYYAVTHGYTACRLCKPIQPTFNYSVSSYPNVSIRPSVILCILGVFVVCVIITVLIKKKKRRKCSEKETEVICQQVNQQNIPGMPNDTEIGTDGLPRERNYSGASPWGDKYTVWYSENGTKYHRHNCVWRSNIPVHVVNVAREPCRECRPVIPELAWYHTYLASMSQTKISTGRSAHEETYLLVEDDEGFLLRVPTKKPEFQCIERTQEEKAAHKELVASIIIDMIYGDENN